MTSVTIRRGNPKALDNIAKALQPGTVRIGWFPSARYDDAKSTPVAAIAAQNEYGNPNKNIPARPFMRPAIANNANKWKDIGKRGLKAVIDKKSTVAGVLDLIGVAAVGDVQYAISQVYAPALKRATIDARLAKRTHSGRLTKSQAQGISKPLVDTGVMLATVSYEVQRGD